MTGRVDLSGRSGVSRLARSAMYGVVGQVVSLTAPLVMMPLMLSHLGESRFGLWVTCVSATSVLVFLDLGVGNALTTRLSRALALDDHSVARDLVAGAFKIYISIVLFGSLVSIVCLGYLKWLFKDESYVNIGMPVLLSFLLSFPAGIIYRIYHAQQRMLSYNLLLAGAVVFAVSASILAIRLEAPYWTTVTLLSGSPVLVAAIALYFDGLSGIGCCVSLRDILAAKTKILLGLGSRYFILSILTNIGMNSDLLIISTVVGKHAAANAAIPIKIGTVLVTLVGFAFMPLWSMHAELLARGEPEQVRRLSVVAAGAGAVAVAILGAILVCFVDDAVYVWMGVAFPGQQLIVFAMAVLACVVAITAPYNMILNSQGYAAEQVLPWSIFVLIAVLAKFALLAEDVLWLAPAITAVAYALFIAPSMIYLARRSL